MAETAAIPLLSQPFYFVRHGESESNPNQTVAGTLDVALTERGREQARATATALMLELLRKKRRGRPRAAVQI